MKNNTNARVPRENIFLMADKSGRFEGEAYIRVEKEREINDMLSLNNKEFNNKTITIEKSSQDSFKRKNVYQENSSSHSVSPRKNQHYHSSSKHQ